MTTIRVSRALRGVGFTGAALGMVTVLVSTWLYAGAHEFSLWATYMSDVGNTPWWPQVVFNTGMLISAPVRYLFLVLLVLRLRALGAGGGFAMSALSTGTLVVLGSIGMSAIPASADVALHKGSALLYFLGAVALQTLVGVQEWRRRLPAVLPASSLAVVAVYLVFAVLLVMVGRVEGVTRTTPVIWEWLALCALMFWLLAHSVVLGDDRLSRA